MPKFVMAEIKKQIHGRGPDDLVFGDGENYLPAVRRLSSGSEKSLDRAFYLRLQVVGYGGGGGI